MAKVKIILLGLLVAILLAIVVYVGIENTKLKSWVRKLLKAKADLELDSLKKKADNQKEKVRRTREKASKKRAAYRDSIKSLNSKKSNS